MFPNCRVIFEPQTLMFVFRMSALGAEMTPGNVDCPKHPSGSVVEPQTTSQFTCDKLTASLRRNPGFAIMLVCSSSRGFAQDFMERELCRLT